MMMMMMMMASHATAINNQLVVTVLMVITGAMSVGYLWAWIGHFFIEKNKPATFTFATFSFLGDIRLYLQTLNDLKAMIVH